MARDVLITPASGIVEFKNDASVDASIQVDTIGNLTISHPGGDLIIGNAGTNVYIGDGTNNVDVIFEQSGAIRALAGKTLTLGQDDSYIIIDAPVTYTSPDTTKNITTRLYNTGELSFDGSSGQLFSITDSLSGTIYSVNDISGIPSIEVLDTGLVKLAEYNGNVLIGTGTDNGLDKVQVNGFISMGGLKQAQITVTAAATTDLNFSASNNFYLTLNQNVTFTFSNVSNNIGASGYIFMLQDGTGGKTFTLPAVAKTPGGRTISQVTTANSLSMINYYVVSATVVVINYIGDFK